MVGCNGVTIFMLVVAGVLLFHTTTSYAAPHVPSYAGYYSPVENQNPEYILQTIARLRQALLAEEDLENAYGKRSPKVDFGMARAYSGESEARSRIAAEAAMSPYGPGRKRSIRSDIYDTSSLKLTNY